MERQPTTRWQIPDQLLYSPRHQWCLLTDDGSTCVTGVTDYTQHQAGEILYVGLPAEGERLEAGDPMGTVESGKWVGQVYAPVSGTVVAVNHRLLTEPTLLNQDPYGQGWIARMTVEGPVDGLLDAETYRFLVDMEEDEA